MSLALALSSLTPLVTPSVANAATSGPFTVESVCGEDNNVIFNLSLEEELPNWFLGGNLYYKTPAGNSPKHWLGVNDTDSWSVNTGSMVASSVEVSAEVRGPLLNTLIKKYTLMTDTMDCTPPVPPTAPSTRPVLSGEIIYDAVPATLPSNSPSLGYQATSTSAFGDKITFGGTGRELDKVAVNLSSWACESGTWNNSCVTTPGSTFTHPVTLNIYNVAEDGTVGSLIATRTQTFEIPYRPTADPTCGTATQWRDTNGNCFNGYNYVVTFDANGITVPNTVIYSVAYNTQSYGVSPLGVDGPFNSLNVALSTSTTVGTNIDANEVFWDTTYPGYTAGLKADSGWSADGNPAVIFTAKIVTPPVDNGDDNDDEPDTDNSGPNTPAPGVNNPQPLATPAQFLAAAANESEDEEVLGTQTGKDSTDDSAKSAADSAVKGASDAGGFAWYWWLLLIAVLGGIAWWLFAAARRRSEDN